MTAAWLALAVAVICWPAGSATRRTQALARSQRLAAVDSAPARNWLAVARHTGQFASAWFTESVLAPTRVRRSVTVGAGLAAGIALSSWGLPGVAAAAATAVAVGTGLALLRSAGARRHRAQREAAIAQALAVIVGELDAGASPAVALRATAPIAATAPAGRRGGWLGSPGPETSISQQIAHALAGGAGGVARAAASDPLERVVAAWRVSTATGVALTDVLARVRADLAASADARREVGVTVAGPRSSAFLLALLPVLGVGLGVAMGANPVHVLLATGPGRLLLCAGVVLDAVGLLWTDALTARAQR